MPRIDHSIKVTVAGGPVFNVPGNQDADSYYQGDYPVPAATAPAAAVEVLIPDLTVANVEAAVLLIWAPQGPAEVSFTDPDPAAATPGTPRRLRGPLLIAGPEAIATLGLGDRLFLTNPDPNVAALVRVLIGINAIV